MNEVTLTDKEKTIMFGLVHEPTSNDRELADKYGQNPSTVTAIRHRLFEKGYLSTYRVPQLNHLGCELLRRWIAPQALRQVVRRANQLVDLTPLVHGYADGAALLGDGARHTLSDPVRRIRREFGAALVVELVDGADQANVPILRQIQERYASPARVLERYADDQPRVTAY